MQADDQKQPPALDAHTIMLQARTFPAATFCSPEVPLGTRLRLIRQEKGLSIRALAQRCGLSANTLSLIENNRTSPSVNTLENLARGLDVPIVDFFSEKKPEHGLVYQQQGQRLKLPFANGTLEMLGEGLPPLGAEPILVTLESSNILAQEISHSGREFMYCLEGEVLCVVAGQEYQLRPGDSLLFEATAAHRWVNTHSNSSKILVLFCPLEANDQPAERHLGA